MASPRKTKKIKRTRRTRKIRRRKTRKKTKEMSQAQTTWKKKCQTLTKKSNGNPEE